ncbi:MAG: four-carbon acid sugar kinase family protein [Nitrosomonadales bacterium]
MPDYIEEKTAGRISSTHVERFLIGGCTRRQFATADALSGNTCCVVDAETQNDLNHFADQLRVAASRGKRFLFRSAASLITALARLPSQPVAAQDMSQYVRDGRPGAVIVGSHVRKTTLQLGVLLKMQGVVPIEVDVEQLTDNRDVLLAEIVQKCIDVHIAGRTPSFFTRPLGKGFY